MSFLGEPFKHDLFVSYSHGDFDRSGRSNLKTWSQAFVRELEDELRQHPKFSRLKIFFDQGSRPDQGVDPLLPLPEQLRHEIGASGILVVLMSPFYLSSKWCADERDWWVECQAKYGLSLHGRIFVVRIWLTDGPWPDAFLDERGEPPVGFTFYDLERVATRPQPYEWPDPTGAKGPFRDAMLDLVGRIWQRLDVLKAELEEHQRRRVDELSLHATEGGHVVYLHARNAHAHAWEVTRNALEGEGFIVMPVDLDPASRDPNLMREIMERRLELLMACDGLFLLGTEDARILDLDLIDVGRKDRLSVHAKTGRALPCAVLNTAGAFTTTPRRKTIARQLGIDWIEATGNSWPAKVLKWLSEENSKGETSIFPDEDKSKNDMEERPDLSSDLQLNSYDVFLAYSRKDVDKAKYLAYELEKRGYSVFWDSRILPGDEWRERILQTLSGSKCVLVAWSRHSIKSRWVKNEAEESVQQGKYIPVLFDQSQIPFGFRETQATDLTTLSPGARSEPFESLLKAIAARAKPRPAGRRRS